MEGQAYGSYAALSIFKFQATLLDLFMDLSILYCGFLNPVSLCFIVDEVSVCGKVF